MDELQQKIVLEKFLNFHQIEMLPTARLSHFGRRFARFFPEIAEQANPDAARWTSSKTAALAAVVAGLDPSAFSKRNDTPDFKVAKKHRKLNKTKAFLLSSEWRNLRYDVLRDRGRRCESCGATAKDASRSSTVRIEVDHIKPISKFWHLRLDRANLQVLCRDCNKGKGNRYLDDHR
jgi:HNH endonuclease